MLKNHVRIFIRHISRHKLYGFINISGLAVGMAACILILLFIESEVSYENMHGKADRVVPWQMSQAMYDRAGDPRELWLIGEMGHYEVWEAQPEAAQARLLAFFETALSRGGDLVGAPAKRFPLGRG